MGGSCKTNLANKKQGSVRACTSLIGSGQGQVVDSCEKDNEILSSIKDGHFLIIKTTISFSRRSLFHKLVRYVKLPE